MEHLLDTPLETILERATLPASALDLTATGFVPASGVLGFAPAPTALAVSADRAVPMEHPAVVDRPAPVALPKRRLRVDWYAAVVILLILSCGALCIYRLMWAIQP